MIFKHENLARIVLLGLVVASLVALLPPTELGEHGITAIAFRPHIAIQCQIGKSKSTRLKGSMVERCRSHWRRDATRSHGALAGWSHCRGLGGCGAAGHAAIMTAYAPREARNLSVWCVGEVAMLVGVRPPGDDEPPRA